MAFARARLPKDAFQRTRIKGARPKKLPKGDLPRSPTEAVREAIDAICLDLVGISEDCFGGDASARRKRPLLPTVSEAELDENRIITTRPSIKSRTNIGALDWGTLPAFSDGDAEQASNFEPKRKFALAYDDSVVEYLARQIARSAS